MVFAYLVVFGMLVTLALGFVASSLERKLSARIQWRVGPPWYQPLADIIKLLRKEMAVPSGTSRVVFLGAPVLGLAGACVGSTLLWLANLQPRRSPVGDLIMVVFLLAVPAFGAVLGGRALRNPLATAGASREANLLLAYELPFVLSAVTVIVKGHSIALGDLVLAQQRAAPFAASASGVLALVVAFVCMQAKLTLVPFDLPEADTEVMGGPYAEYSGPALGVYKLSRVMLLFLLPFLLVTLFLGGARFDSAQGVAVFAGKYLGLLLLAILVKNTNPRLRMDQAVRFFLGPAALLAAVAVVLAARGW